MSTAIKIEKLISGGCGLGYLNGKPIFVFKAVPGDEVEIDIVKNKKDYIVGKIKKIIEASHYRVKSPCTHFEKCGGCEHQNISYPNQLKFKEEILRELLLRNKIICHSEPEGGGGKESQLRSFTKDRGDKGDVQDNMEILPIMPGSNQPFYFRNSIRFFFIHKNDGSIAFGRSQFDDPRRLVEIDSCLLQSDTTNKIIAELKNFINKNVNDKKFFWQLKIREGKQTGEFMVEIITTSHDLPQKEGIAALLKNIDGVKSIYHTVTPAKSLKKLERHLIYGSPIIHEKIGKYSFQISPESFFQTNSLGVKTLYDKIKEFADIKMGERVLDLYSGTGTIGIYLAALAKEVVCVESVAEAVRDASDNAKLNKVSNVSFFYQDSLEYLSSPQPTSHNPQAIIVDPPRAGLNKQVIDLITKTKTKKVVYVSCNPTTFIRDIKIFEQNNYKLTKVQPVDMFPQSHHLEVVGQLLKL